ncbi:indole-3-glycerol phosphate synthase TrpC [Heyndrickxia camelliae]|uniref:Indole-3-glycerol phosphate synthase n=1 Tax=Heyndrickxia camelliae TaxID=1707093 RepID=A0A2N3LIU8_9BACI|nr:indole-3-glycerol phosphate synthase TrpC [Heyndrickxia camelliae]PKR84505.1 indole-3-glycerol phosphate synthase TrpC [Heyndrickxia camelliae]
MTFLSNILIEKEKEVKILKEQYQQQNYRNIKQEKSMYQTFMESSTMNIIAEIKRASPSKGEINVEVNPVEQAEQYATYGANAISVLTDTPFFKGSIEDLRVVRNTVDLPILCKDFIIEEIQINRAKDYGANVVLLIAAALPKQRLKELFDYAYSIDLEVLLEVHNETELMIALEIGAKIIGINNRDLKTFTVDLSVTQELAKLVNRNDILLIGESGIRNREDVEKMMEAGVRGVLVGETLMRSENLKETLKDLKIEFK